MRCGDAALYLYTALCVCTVVIQCHSYQIHRGSPFPTVAEAIQEDLDDYRTKEVEVSRLKNAMVSRRRQ